MLSEELILLALDLWYSGNRGTHVASRESIWEGDVLYVFVVHGTQQDKRWVVSQREGSSGLWLATPLQFSMGQRGEYIGSCQLFENGEYRIPSSTSNKQFIYYNTDPRGPMQMTCFGCSMTEFKSAVSESLTGKASPDPQRWLDGLDLKKRPRQGLVDVLICQNSHCGEYHSLMYHTDDRRWMLSFGRIRLGRIGGSRRDEFGLRRDAALNHVSGLFPRPLANEIVDFLYARPGLFCPHLSRSSKEPMAWVADEESMPPYTSDCSCRVFYDEMCPMGGLMGQVTNHKRGFAPCFESNGQIIPALEGKARVVGLLGHEFQDRNDALVYQYIGQGNYTVQIVHGRLVSSSSTASASRQV